jgi:5'-nucleotidase
MRLRRIISALLFCLATLATGLALQVQAQQIHAKIIALNDLHGNLNSPGSSRATPDSPEVPTGGVDFLAGYIAHLKSENPNNIVVSAGDLTGASPLLSALFHHEDTIEAANRFGLELNATGNHEFDQGLAELRRYQNGGCSKLDKYSCKGAITGTPVPFEGARFKYLAANTFDTATGKTIFPAYAIRTWHGVKVAFIGVTLRGTPAMVIPFNVRGLRFDDEAAAINANVLRLRAQGVQSFVVLIHQGGYQKVTGSRDINACAGDMGGQAIRPIVSQLDDAIGLVISAHTHEPYVCQLPNRTGRSITVTSAWNFGRVLTDIDLTLDAATKRITAVTAHNILVDRTNPAIQPDPAIRTLVDRYAALSAPLENRVVGSIAADILKPSNEQQETPVAEVVADAQLDATSSPARGGAVAAFTNTTGVRTGISYSSPGRPPGQVTYGELFSTQPFANNLVTMTLTGEQIKTMLEQQFPACALGTPPGEPATRNMRILQVSASFTYTWSRSAEPCHKVSAISIHGVPVDPAAKYRITVNSFLADGGEQLPAFKTGTDRLIGSNDLDALVAYFGKHPALKPPPPNRITIQP